jgi:hypothetical protein
MGDGRWRIHDPLEAHQEVPEVRGWDRHNASAEEGISGPSADSSVSSCSLTTEDQRRRWIAAGMAIPAPETRIIFCEAKGATNLRLQVFGLAVRARADAFLPLIRLLNQSIAQRRNGAEKLEQGIARGELREIKETRGRNALDSALEASGKTAADVADDTKGAHGKIRIAQLLRREFVAPHRWIAEHLNRAHSKGSSR